MHCYYLYIGINIYSFDLAVASDLTFDLTSLSRSYGPPVTLESDPGALPLGIALCEYASSSLYLILLALWRSVARRQ